MSEKLVSECKNFKVMNVKDLRKSLLQQFLLEYKSGPRFHLGFSTFWPGIYQPPGGRTDPSNLLPKVLLLHQELLGFKEI